MEVEQIIDIIIFLKEQEYRIEDKDITVWLYTSDIEEFTDIFDYGTFAEGGIDMKLQRNKIAFNLSEFVGYDEDMELIINKLQKLEGRG